MPEKTAEQIAAEAEAEKLKEQRNAKKPKTVKVRALAHLGEEVDGALVRFEPGKEFELPEPRAKALGALVEIL